MHVYVEGIDLSGKSSTIEHFKNNSNISEPWHVQPGRLALSSELYDVATAAVGNHSLDTVGDLYAVAVRSDLEGYTPPTEPTIQDSLFTIRSLAFFMALQNKRLTEIFEGLLAQQPTFDHSFVFTASAEARQARLEKRMSEEPDKLSKIDKILAAAPDFANTVSDNIVGLTKEVFSATTIDTTNMPIAAASSIMLEIVGTPT